jgi:hypothetical protein
MSVIWYWRERRLTDSQNAVPKARYLCLVLEPVPLHPQYAPGAQGGALQTALSFWAIRTGFV